MLVFITTDAAISPEMLSKALSADIKRSASLPIYARDRSIMYKAFVRMFYVAVG